MYTISRAEFDNQELTLEELRYNAQELWEQGNRLYDYEVKKDGEHINSLTEELS